MKQNSNKYYKIKVQKMSNVTRLWFIQDENKKRCLVNVNDGLLIHKKGGKVIDQDLSKVSMKWLVNVNVEDAHGIYIRVSIWDMFRKLITITPQDAYKQFLQSRMPLPDFYEQILMEINANKYVFVLLTTLNEWKAGDGMTKKIMNYTVEDTDILNEDHPLWSEEDAVQEIY